MLYKYATCHGKHNVGLIRENSVLFLPERATLWPWTELHHQWKSFKFFVCDFPATVPSNYCCSDFRQIFLRHRNFNCSAFYHTELLPFFKCNLKWTWSGTIYSPSSHSQVAKHGLLAPWASTRRNCCVNMLSFACTEHAFLSRKRRH